MKRWIGVGVVGWIAVFAGWVWMPTTVAAAPLRAEVPTATAQSEYTPTLPSATIVVQLDERRSLVRQVPITSTTSGLALLKATGLAVAVAESSFGPVVCAIQGTGCPAEECFCDDRRYWNYSFWTENAWQPYAVGAASSAIHAAGAVEGWRWGAAESQQTPADRTLAAAQGLTWLHSQQEPATGGFGESFSAAVEVMLALGANAEKPASWLPANGRRSLETFWLLRVGPYSRANAAAAGKVAVATAATDLCQTARTASPAFWKEEPAEQNTTDTGFAVWGILGAAALGEEIPASTLTALRAQQREDGGWEWQADFGSDTNTTSLAIQALIAGGESPASTSITSALDFLAGAQTSEGGFVYDPRTIQYGADGNSTAYAIQALLAAGEDPEGERWARPDGTPFQFLIGLQQADGAFAWQPGTGSNLLTTAQAVAALLGQTYPFVVQPLESCADRRTRLMGKETLGKETISAQP